MKIKCSLAPSSIDAAIKQLEDYSKDLDRKAQELCERLANYGFQVIFTNLSQHIYSGETISNLQVQEINPNKYVILDGSVALLLLEFGSGLKAVGHPLAGEMNMGPGTYPEQTHALDPNGWWFETNDPNLAVYTSKKTGKSYGHSYGSSPQMPFYNGAKDMRKEIFNIAREVFENH